MQEFCVGGKNNAADEGESLRQQTNTDIHLGGLVCGQAEGFLIVRSELDHSWPKKKYTSMTDAKQAEQVSKYLIPDHPLIVLPALAVAIGLNEAIVLQQTHFLLGKLPGKYVDGIHWIKMTDDDWGEQFPFWKRSTIRRAISRLVEDCKVLLKTDGLNSEPLDRSSWYTVDYKALNKIPTRKPRKKRDDCPNLGQWLNDQKKLKKQQSSDSRNLGQSGGASQADGEPGNSSLSQNTTMQSRNLRRDSETSSSETSSSSETTISSQPAIASATDALAAEFDETPVTSKALENYQVAKGEKRLALPQTPLSEQRLPEAETSASNRSLPTSDPHGTHAADSAAVREELKSPLQSSEKVSPALSIMPKPASMERPSVIHGPCTMPDYAGNMPGEPAAPLPAPPDKHRYLFTTVKPLIAHYAKDTNYPRETLCGASTVGLANLNRAYADGYTICPQCSGKLALAQRAADKPKAARKAQPTDALFDAIGEHIFGAKDKAGREAVRGRIAKIIHGDKNGVQCIGIIDYECQRQSRERNELDYNQLAQDVGTWMRWHKANKDYTVKDCAKVLDSWQEWRGSEKNGGDKDWQLVEVKNELGQWIEREVHKDMLALEEWRPINREGMA